MSDARELWVTGAARFEHVRVAKLEQHARALALKLRGLSAVEREAELAHEISVVDRAREILEADDKGGSKRRRAA